MRYTILRNSMWHYARNYPKDVRAILGIYKCRQPLQTSDAKIAAQRSAQVNVRYEETVRRVRQGIQDLPESENWQRDLKITLSTLDIDPLKFESPLRKANPIAGLVKTYLRYKGQDLSRGAYKSVRYSLGLFASEYGTRDIRKLTRDDGRVFQHKIAQLAKHLGKSPEWQNKSLETLRQASVGRADLISVRTRKRMGSQVNAFLDWSIYEGLIDLNPFRTVRFEGKVIKTSYAVLTDVEVKALLDHEVSIYTWVFRLCLLSGMRSGEALGLRRSDLIDKGNLGTFIRIAPNELRGLKTEAAERLVPLHPEAEGALHWSPTSDRIFPNLTVNQVTKWFRARALKTGVNRANLVFHSSRKWFITNCERQGVPEHFTASIVGHKAARSGNGMTYAIYSGGISDDQKRDIIDRIRLPT